MYLFLFIVLLIIIIGVFILSAFGRIVGGVFRPRNGEEHTSGRQNGRTTYKTSPKKSKKVFEKTEGEYVDFEEVKDEKKPE